MKTAFWAILCGKNLLNRESAIFSNIFERTGSCNIWIAPLVVSIDECKAIHLKQPTECLFFGNRNFSVKFYCTSLDGFDYYITAWYFIQSYKSGRDFRVGFGPGSDLKLTKISGLNRAWDVLFVLGAQYNQNN